MATSEQIDNILAASPQEELRTVLEGSTEDRRLEPLFLRLGSCAFNGFNVAIQLLHEKPAQPLVESYVKPSNNSSRMENYLTSILNDSLTRAVTSYGVNRGPEYPFSLYGACSEAEEKFDKAIRPKKALKFPNTKYSSTIFVNPEGEPVFFKKSKSYGTESSLSFKEVTLEGIAYPPGTIFIVDSVKHASGLEDNYHVERIDRKGYLGLAALRLSAFALPLEEREQALASDDEEYHSLGETELNRTLDDLRSRLPDNQKLLEAAKSAPKKGGFISVRSMIPGKNTSY